MIQSFNGKTPQIHETAFVHPDATVIGDVEIHAYATIWPGTVLRGDMGKIIIGKESSIQDGTICHLTEGWSSTIIGEKVTVGHRVILHGCIVEDQCLIGMGAILLDNSHIRQGSLVGAGTLITAGKDFPERHAIMGFPAKDSRPLKEREAKMIEGGHETYVKYGAIYKNEMEKNIIN